VQTQFPSAPFLPSQGSPAAAVSCLVSIEHDLAAVCRKALWSADLVTFVSPLRWPAAELRLTLGRRQPAENASVDGGSTDVMDPRSVPSSVVES